MGVFCARSARERNKKIWNYSEGTWIFARNCEGTEQLRRFKGSRMAPPCLKVYRLRRTHMAGRTPISGALLETPFA